ncbi:TRAP transporter small permease (plasmid) [Salipiger sp. H15]|uniref:TRAP transporter small permease protein n=1 Tax=Alloyangia sp. H15 TaxID=3029062 RepID=A0AAU8APL5_9RHOB
MRHCLALICAVLLLAMMALTVADVLGRYLLNAPLPGATELTEMLLATVVFIGLPAASLDRDHIRVDLCVEHLRGAARTLLERLVEIASAGILGVIAWRLWVIGAQIDGYGGMTPTLKLPLAPLAWLAALLCLCAAAILLVLALKPGEARDV